MKRALLTLLVSLGMMALSAPGHAQQGAANPSSPTAGNSGQNPADIAKQLHNPLSNLR